MSAGDQCEQQGRVQLRRVLVRALRWCAADKPATDYTPLNPADRRALRRLYRLASLRQQRGSLLVAATLDIWRGLVFESKRCAPVPPAQEQSIPQPKSPCTPAALNVRECGDHPAAAHGGFLTTSSKTAVALVCRDPGCCCS